MSVNSDPFSQQVILAEFGMEAFNSTNIDTLYNLASNRISRGLSNVHVMVLEHGNPSFTVRSEYGWGITTPKSLPIAGAAGECLRMQEPIIFDNLEESTISIPSFFTTYGCKSLAVVPVTSRNGGPQVVLKVCSKKLNDFDAHDLIFLRNYSNLLGAAADRVRMTEELTATIRYKDVLLAELQHRVKNNLQVIVSLVNQQRRSMSNDLTVITSRIEALRLIYDKLNLDSYKGSVRLDEYCCDLINNLLSLEGINVQNVKTNINCEKVTVDIDRAVPVGLIISEFVMNSLKYAFNTVRGGTLTLSIKNKGGRVLLRLADDGCGIKHEDYDKGMGLRLISQLANQADAQLTWLRPKNGTSLQLEFEAGHVTDDVELVNQHGEYVKN